MSKIIFPDPVTDVTVEAKLGRTYRMGDMELMYGGLLSVDEGVLHFLLNVHTFGRSNVLALRMPNNGNREIELEGGGGDVHTIKIINATHIALTFSYIKLD